MVRIAMQDDRLALLIQQLSCHRCAFGHQAAFLLRHQRE